MVAQLRGLWRRSLIRWPDGSNDTSTVVHWLQGPSFYADLRQPKPMRSFSGVRALADLSGDDCRWLARQEGFAGELGFDGRWFEWHRLIDLQPKSTHADAGTLHWDQHRLVELGREIPYLEQWERDDAVPIEPCAAFLLRDPVHGIRALLIRVGGSFMFARERRVALPAGCSLLACVDAAHSLEEARGLIDCEVSYGEITARDFRVTASTLPHRVSDSLEPELTDDTVSILDGYSSGRRMRRNWSIVASEGRSRDALPEARPGGKLFRP